VIAFLTALIVAILCDIAVVVYSKRRPVGKYLTWGEAMLAATFAFVLFNLWYGVIPHQWITLADNEWGWRSDRIVYGPLDVLEPNRFVPMTISYQVLRDIIVTLIYGVGLGLQIFHWVQWNERGKKTEEVVPTTTYGRPLARRA
jgi:hypothetical protein